MISISFRLLSLFILFLSLVFAFFFIIISIRCTFWSSMLIEDCKNVWIPNEWLYLMSYIFHGDLFIVQLLIFIAIGVYSSYLPLKTSFAHIQNRIQWITHSSLYFDLKLLFLSVPVALDDWLFLGHHSSRDIPLSLLMITVMLLSNILCIILSSYDLSFSYCDDKSDVITLYQNNFFYPRLWFGIACFYLSIAHLVLMQLHLVTVVSIIGSDILKNKDYIDSPEKRILSDFYGVYYHYLLFDIFLKKCCEPSKDPTRNNSLSIISYTSAISNIETSRESSFSSSTYQEPNSLRY